MLSAVLKSDIAIDGSIQLIHAFVCFRKFHIQNATIFQRLVQVELKLLEQDEKFNRIAIPYP